MMLRSFDSFFSTVCASHSSQGCEKLLPAFFLPAASTRSSRCAEKTDTKIDCGYLRGDVCAILASPPCRRAKKLEKREACLNLFREQLEIDKFRNRFPSSCTRTLKGGKNSIKNRDNKFLSDFCRIKTWSAPWLGRLLLERKFRAEVHISSHACSFRLLLPSHRGYFIVNEFFMKIYLFSEWGWEASANGVENLPMKRSSSSGTKKRFRRMLMDRCRGRQA